MKGLKKVACLLVMAGLASSGVSGAALTTAGTPAISVTRGPSGSVTIGLKDPTVAIQKVLRPGSSVTTLTAGGERVVLTLDGQNVVISASGKVARGNLSQPGTLTQVFDVLRASAAAGKAKRLLDRAVLPADSFRGNALLLTRALLGSVVGDEAGSLEYRRWVNSKASQRKVVRIQDDFDRLPGECWDEYAKEAIRIQKDLEECVKECGRPRLGFCQAGCGLIFEIRAEAAMMWFMRCSGGFFVG